MAHSVVWGLVSVNDLDRRRGLKDPRRSNGLAVEEFSLGLGLLTFPLLFPLSFFSDITSSGLAVQCTQSPILILNNDPSRRHCMCIL